MDWSNEEYVRLYTRETADDLELSWEALALWRAMLTKFDRAGVLSVRNGWPSVARLVRMPIDVVEKVGPELIADGRVRVTERGFVAPNYVEAQTASKSDRIRQKESRDRRRADAMSQPRENSSTLSQNVTPGHEVSQAVTPSHTPSRNVTLTSADPLLTDHSLSAGGDRVQPGDVKRKLEWTAWHLADTEHRSLKASGIDSNAIHWAPMPMGEGGSELGKRVSELLTTFTDAADVEVRLRHVVAVRVAEAKRTKSLRYFVPSTMWASLPFWKAAEMSLEHASTGPPDKRDAANKAPEPPPSRLM